MQLLSPKVVSLCKRTAIQVFQVSSFSVTFLASEDKFHSLEIDKEIARLFHENKRALDTKNGGRTIAVHAFTSRSTGLICRHII